MQTVTIELSDSIYQNAHQIAEATQRSLETVLQNSLANTLPPLDDVPPEEAAELAALTLLDDAALWRKADIMMTETEQAELQALLDQQGAGEISLTGKKRLQELIDVYGRLMVHKAHAWLLLARRGYRVPPNKIKNEG